MEIKGRVTIRACCLFLLMLFLIMMSTGIISSQERPPTPPSGQPGMDTGNKAQQNQDLLKGIKGWVQKHPFLTLIWGILAPVLAFIFKDPIKKMVTEEISPLLTRLFTRFLILFGRYRALLKRYRRTLQRRLREGGLTRQLIGEGVDLEENYIPIQISKEEYKNPEFVPSFESKGDVQRKDRSRAAVEGSRRERIEVNEALTNEGDYGNRIAIIGDPGSGKTTLMQHLAYECAKNEGVKPIPALVTLIYYVASEAKDFPSYLPTIFEENAFPKAQDYLETQLKAGRLLILLDGFDEVEIGKRDSVRKQIEAFANNEEYLQNKFVVTSRPIRDAVFDNFKHLEVMPLLPEQRKAFLESKVDNSPDSEFDSHKCAELVGAIEGHDRIRNLASNPLLLTFLYYVYKYNLELPRRRSELYRQSINLMLDWDIKTGRPTHIKVRDRDAKKEVLKNVAYYYHTNATATREVPRDELIEQVDKHLPDSLEENFTAEALIAEIENSSGILRHSAAESYQFIHLTFQEYLTADYINDNRDTEVAKLMENLSDFRWREVVLLLAGIMGNATPLVSRILGYREELVDESESLSCLFIALICLYEAQVDDAVRDHVFEAFSNVPYDQAAEVIESTFGSLEKMSIEFEMLLGNILNSQNESVRGWGVGFLSQYISNVPYDQAAGVIESAFGALEEMSKELEAFLVSIFNSPNELVRGWGMGFLNQYASQMQITGQDGAPMVFIPAGEFLMGRDKSDDEQPSLPVDLNRFYIDKYDDGEDPSHLVYLDTFYIDKYEVTNAQYKEFIDANPQWSKDGIESKYHDGDYLNGWNRYGNDYLVGKGNHPVNWVSWYAAKAYAEWAGKRLPTEAQWEKAARGGLVGMKYPWGDEITDENANYVDNEGVTTPVGSHPPIGYGLCDMTGSVWEWCADWYDENYYANSRGRNPTGPSSGEARVMRGGSWYNDPDFLRVAHRNCYVPATTDFRVGLRCVSQD